MTPEDDIAVEVACDRWNDVLPGCAELVRTAAAAAVAVARAELDGRVFPIGNRAVELSILLTDDVAVRALNRDYRGKDAATNVLSFSALEDESGALPCDAAETPKGAPVVLGDVVIARETTLREAADEEKTLADHLSHLVVHGILHLLGCRHDDETEAEYMEGLEVRVLRGLGVADPYVRAG